MIDEMVAATLQQAVLIREQSNARNQHLYQQTRMMLLLAMGLTLMAAL